MTNKFQQHISNFINSANVLINYVINQLGQSEYDIKVDPTKRKGNLTIDNKILGKVELELANGKQNLLTPTKIKYKTISGQKFYAGFRAPHPTPKKKTQQPAPASLSELIKNFILTELNQSKYSLNMDSANKKGLIGVVNPHFGKADLEVVKKTGAKGFKATKLNYINLSGQTTTYTFAGKP